MNRYEELGFFDFEDFVSELSDEQLIAVNDGSRGGGCSSSNCSSGSPSYTPQSSKIFFLLFILLSFSVSCSQDRKAQVLFNEATVIFENANTIDWIQSTPEKESAIRKLDEAIEIAPNWWLPYREKIQIMKIGCWQDNAKIVNDVYNLWLDNGNELNGYSEFTYACSLYCCNKKNQAMEIFEKLYQEIYKENMTDEEKVIYILSGIIIEKISENNFQTVISKIFDASMMGYFEDFLNNFEKADKDTVWAYVG